ncbi:hypothetical protein BJX66DRAFT_287153 [Aspergillus keveii]|uniref:Uncharacterized protein n=1 Tax=Aspergillus keveii TaxID=714993 RepID=A0ABR4FVM6_9EURO
MPADTLPSFNFQPRSRRGTDIRGLLWERCIFPSRVGGSHQEGMNNVKVRLLRHFTDQPPRDCWTNGWSSDSSQISSVPAAQEPIVRREEDTVHLLTDQVHSISQLTTSVKSVPSRKLNPILRQTKTRLLNEQITTWSSAHLPRTIFAGLG